MSERARGGGDVKICLREQNQSSEMHPADRPTERARNRPSERRRGGGGGARAAAAGGNARSIHYRGKRERGRERGPIANFGRPRDQRRRRRSFCTGAGPTGFVCSRQSISAWKNNAVAIHCGKNSMVHFLRIKPNQRESKKIACFIHSVFS